MHPTNVSINWEISQFFPKQNVVLFLFFFAIVFERNMYDKF